MIFNIIQPIKGDIKVFRDDLYPFLGGGNKGRKMDAIAKDIFFKALLPILAVLLLYGMFIELFTKDGITNWFYMWLACGLPFGIWRMRICLIPMAMAIAARLGSGG